jgi:hypothetical protein
MTFRIQILFISVMTVTVVVNIVIMFHIEIVLFFGIRVSERKYQLAE